MEEEEIVDSNIVTADQMDAAFSGAAILANRIVLTMNSVSARLSFLEISPTGKVEFRTAVNMSIGDLIALKTLLEKRLEGAQLVNLPARDDGQ